MSLWRQVSRGLRSLFRRSRTDREIADEVQDYFDRATEAHVSRGLSREEARRAARLEIGPSLGVREEVRWYGWENCIEVWLADLRYAVRSLRANPSFSIVVILTLALGIGANTAIFSVVYAALVRPLPYFQPDRLLTLSQKRSQTDGPFWNASYPDFLDWQMQSKTFQSLAGFTGDGTVLRGMGDPELLSGAAVTTNFFATLGVKPVLGRDFAAGEDVSTGPDIVILSYGFWRNRLAGDPSILGRTLQFDDRSVRVVGVLPREFEFAPRGTVQYWVPMHAGPDMKSRRNLRWMPVIGRLVPNVTPQQNRSEMDLITRRLAAAYPAQNAAIQVTIIPLRERIVGQVQPVLLILFGAVAIVLIIACANAGNLLVARASRRRREFAIRTALGAGWGRLVSQNLSEVGVLAVVGGVLGLLLAHWGTGMLILPIPKAQLSFLPFLLDAHTNAVVLVFVGVVSILVTLSCGLVGALESFHHRHSSTINEESRTSTAGGRKRLRDVLVISEVAFSLVLLMGAGLMGRSLTMLLHRDPGFDTRNLLNFNVNLPDSGYPKAADAARFNQEFTARLRAIPGVDDVAANNVVPLTGGGNTIRFVIEGQPVDTGRENESNYRTISSNYFSTMRIPLMSGRLFDDATDTSESPRRIIVSQAWVKRFMPDQNPLGRRVRFTYSPTQPYREIVGVVSDSADAGLDRAADPSLFAPAAQSPLTFIPYLLRASVPPATLIGPIRAALKTVDPALVMIQPRTMGQIADQSPSVFLRRYPSYLIGSCAALALFLVVIGLYGLISYSVTQRTRELAVRIALGARPQSIMQLIVRQGAKLVLIGSAIGVVAALVLTRVMSSLLFGVSAGDPATLLGAVILLALVAGAACTIPARRAVRTDPIIALREM